MQEVVHMPSSEKDRLAAEITRLRSEFEAALFGNKRRYPLQEFMAFWEAGKRYAELTKSDRLIHRSVVVAVHGLEDIVGQGRKRIPDQVPWDLQRLKCLLLSGYDPQFEGDEPPGL